MFGLVDGTHVALTGLPKRTENSFVNRKGFHSINVQIVSKAFIFCLFFCFKIYVFFQICDCDLRILGANARFPGSSHDSYIWKSSVACAHLMNEHRRNPESGLYLLGNLLFGQYFITVMYMNSFNSPGDSGYPLQPWIMTPIQSPTEDHERTYNAEHAKTRNKVERCIGVLKSRFRCLSTERKLRYMPDRAAKIILSCVVLHNFLIGRRYTDNINQQINDSHHVEVNEVHRERVTSYLIEARAVRDSLAHTLHDNSNM